MNQLTVERNKDGDYSVIVPKGYVDNILDTAGEYHTSQINYLINLISSGIYKILFEEYFARKGDE